MLAPLAVSTRSGWNRMRLCLCEKPSQGKDIGKVLGATQRDNGCLKGPGVIVTWCIGHLVEAAPPEAYDEQLKRWSIEPLPIIPERWRDRESVVSDKSVSVRVDLGGRRIIKKKNTQHNKN